MLSEDSSQSGELFTPVAVGNRIILDWIGGGVLEYSPDLEEPWTTIDPPPVPPFSEIMNGPSRFYRLKE